MIRILTLAALISGLLFSNCKPEATAVEETTTRRQVPNDPPMYNELPANQVMDMLIKNLEERLSLSEQQKGQIKQLYLNQHLANGGSAEEIIQRGQGKEFRESLVKETAEEVKKILSEDQWKFYANNLL